MASGAGSEDGDIGFQIAPMVDVVFVLLLFFMASAGSQVVPKELTINLPSGRGNPNPNAAINSIIVDIAPDGQVAVNGKAYDNPTSKPMPELRAFFTDTINKFGDKDPVVIRPSPQTRQERIIDVLNSAAAAGVKNLTFS